MKNILKLQRDYFNTDITKSIAFRKEMLWKFLNAIKANEEQFYLALKKDLNKSEIESYLTEMSMLYGEINLYIKNIDKWQKPKRVSTPITSFPANSYIYREAYGSVLILSPWNYPVQLALIPLAASIVAGNCSVLKTSASSINVSNLIKKIISETFDPKYIACINGDFTHEEILNEKYDLIFFTGSEKIGKQVYLAASKHLTPVVLELGGKSPCIIEKSANLDIAAKRISWGKYLNAGQTCVAPDYILIDESIKNDFIEKLQNQILIMYGNALENPDYPKIINEHHFKRLIAFIDSEKDKYGGSYDANKLSIAPTIFTNTNFADSIMQEEIFGPILPIISYNNIEDIIYMLKERSKPLALYLFTENKVITEKIINSLSFGGGCINDIIMHLANDNLPFGGAGASGLGNYHGKASFETFSRQKSILKSKNILDIPLRYPPYTEEKIKIIKKFMK